VGITDEMSRAKRKAQLNISEPWDKSGLLAVVVQGRAALNDSSILIVSANGELLALQPRYKGEKIEDIWLGERVIVNIAIIKNLVGEAKKLNMTQVEFFAIGSIELLG
jgi:hypothetical protein